MPTNPFQLLTAALDLLDCWEMGQLKISSESLPNSAGEIGGAREGRPRHSNIPRIASVEWIAAKILMRPPQRSQTRTSTSKRGASIQPTNSSLDGMGVPFENSRDDQRVFIRDFFAFCKEVFVRQLTAES